MGTWPSANASGNKAARIIEAARLVEENQRTIDGLKGQIQFLEGELPQLRRQLQSAEEAQPILEADLKKLTG